jgi:hypothetical protein
MNGIRDFLFEGLDESGVWTAHCAIFEIVIFINGRLS